MSKPKDVMDSLEKLGVIFDVGHVDGRVDARVAQILQRFPNVQGISWGWIPSSAQPGASSGPVTMGVSSGGGSDALMILVQPSGPEFDL